METRELTVNFGPQHPSTHGVFRAEVDIDGEIITRIKPTIGFLHRSIEKMAEKRTYAQFIPVTDRLDYTGSSNNNLAYCMAVEKLAGIEVPQRAQYLRVLSAELNRIASHLVAVMATALDAGAQTVMFYCLRDRELVLSIFEKLCGARLTYNYVRIGGVSRDLPDGLVDEIQAFVDYFPDKIDNLDKLFYKSRMFKQRAQGIGVLSREDALSYGASGPTLRASGVDYDVRKAIPYLVYDRMDFDVPVGSAGDSFERTVLRIEELRQSLRILKQVVDEIPEGPIQAPGVPRLLAPPAGEAFVHTESPRGDLGFHIVSDGTPYPYRLKVRGPAYSNLSTIETIGLGCMVSDFIIALGSLDPVFGEVDR
ncbi:MAG: NADH-quinone oxidoreductase subunit D [Candidatus Aquicultorales bacterium]